MNRESRFVIVGLGLLGGAYARGLRRAGYAHVAALDLKEEALAFAKEKGYIEEGRTGEFQDLLARADYIIFSLYPTTFIQWVEQYGSLLPAGCLCTDVSGVKTGLVDKVQPPPKGTPGGGWTLPANWPRRWALPASMSSARRNTTG